MNIRPLLAEDIFKLSQIHKKFYDWTLPNFQRNFLSSFIIEDKGEIVTGGGIKLIPEIVLVTDLSKPVRVRRSALLGVLDAVTYVASENGYDSIYAAIENAQYEHQLKKYKFEDTKGKMLVLGV